MIKNFCKYTEIKNVTIIKRDVCRKNFVKYQILIITIFSDLTHIIIFLNFFFETNLSYLFTFVDSVFNLPYLSLIFHFFNRKYYITNK